MQRARYQPCADPSSSMCPHRALVAKASFQFMLSLCVFLNQHAMALTSQHSVLPMLLLFFVLSKMPNSLQNSLLWFQHEPNFLFFPLACPSIDSVFLLDKSTRLCLRQSVKPNFQCIFHFFPPILRVSNHPRPESLPIRCSYFGKLYSKLPVPLASGKAVWGLVVS